MTESGREVESLRGLLSDVQRMGLTTATAVVDRFSAMVRTLGADVAGGDPSPNVWVAAVRDLAGMAQGMFDAVGLASTPSSVVETVVLPAVVPGAVATGRVWLHNTTAEAAHSLSLRYGQLIGSGSAMVPAACISLAPDDFLTAPPLTSVPIDIEIAVPGAQQPGTYHGHLVLSDPPGGAVGLRLIVTNGGPAR
jgi:hypothetical protein